jgi:hypothetical protein
MIVNSEEKSASVRSMLSMIPLNVAFRRSLMGANLRAWHDVVAMVADVYLTNQRSFCLGPTSEWVVFSQIHVQSFVIPYNTLIWKLKLPLIIKVFMWYLYKGVVLTKDNLVRRQWQEDRKCCFCSSNESIQHLLFDCLYAKFMWRIV